MATASAAHATIIVFNTPLTSDNSTLGNTYWNIDGTGGNEVRFYNGSYSYKDANGNANAFKWVINAPGQDKLQGLASNVAIGSANPFKNYVGTVFLSGSLHKTVGFTSGVSTYVGFQFTPAGTVLYGWANVTLTNGGADGTFTINQWAYEDSGASILTGATSAIPEPATYALGLGALALGAAGLRRRRLARAAAV